MHQTDVFAASPDQLIGINHQYVLILMNWINIVQTGTSDHKDNKGPDFKA